MADAPTLPDSMLNPSAPAGLPASDVANLEQTLGKIKKTQSDENKDPSVVAARQASVATSDKAEKEVGDAYDKIAPFKPEKAPNAKDFQTNPLQAFGSVGSLFAVLASGFTHQPAINSMNAMAASIKAVQAGDAEAYKTAYEAWKDNTQMALDRHKAQHEDYQDAIDHAKTDMTVSDQRLKAATAKYDDQTVELYREMGAYKEIAEIHQSRQNAAIEMIKLQPELEELHARAEGTLGKYQEWFATPAGQAYKAQHPNEKVPPPEIRYKAALDVERDMTAAKSVYATKPMAAQTEFMAAKKAETIAAGQPWDGAAIAKAEGEFKAGGTGLDDDAARMVAEEFLAGNKQAVVGFGRNPRDKEKISNMITTVAKEQKLNGADIAAKQAEYQGLLSGERAVGTRTANMDIAANEVKSMAPLALAASEKVDRTKYPSLNSIILAADKGTGDENVVRFGLAANSLVYMYAKFLNPNGIPTDADKAKSADILSTAWAKGQFKAVVDQIKKEIAVGQGGLQTTKDELRDTLTGGSKSSDGNTIRYDAQGNRVQ